MLLARRTSMDDKARALGPAIGLLLIALLDSAACGNGAGSVKGGSGGAAGSQEHGSGGSAAGGGAGGGPMGADASSMDGPSPDAPGSICGGQRCASANTACCSNCQGGFSCSLIGAFCPAVQCRPVDGGPDVGGGTLPCGTETCGVQQSCVHPAPGGTCVMPDAGQCPAGTSIMSGCCFPPDHPRCVSLDGPCNSAAVSCSCFSTDPCGPSSNACTGAIIQGRDVRCRAG